MVVDDQSEKQILEDPFIVPCAECGKTTNELNTMICEYVDNNEDLDVRN